MKIKFLATGDAPSLYSFDGAVVTATYNGETEAFDFSEFAEGYEYNGLKPNVLPLIYTHLVVDAKRIDGELYLTLCQKAVKGHWAESDWIDSSSYIANTTYIVEVQNG